MLAAARDEAGARIIEQQLGGDYARTLGVELPRRTADDALGRAEYQAEVAARRFAWLESRYGELARRAERRTQAARDRVAGIARFTPPGDISLDQLIKTALETPAAFQELQQQRRDRAAAGREAQRERVAGEIARRNA